MTKWSKMSYDNIYIYIYVWLYMIIWVLPYCYRSPMEVVVWGKNSTFFVGSSEAQHVPLPDSTARYPMVSASVTDPTCKAQGTAEPPSLARVLWKCLENYGACHGMPSMSIFFVIMSHSPQKPSVFNLLSLSLSWGAAASMERLSFGWLQSHVEGRACHGIHGRRQPRLGSTTRHRALLVVGRLDLGHHHGSSEAVLQLDRVPASGGARRLALVGVLPHSPNSPNSTNGTNGTWKSLGFVICQVIVNKRTLTMPLTRAFLNTRLLPPWQS